MKDTNKIRVLSYLPSRLAFTTRNRNSFFAPSDGQVPVTEIMTLEDLEYLNDHSPVLRYGMLEFCEDEQDELYEHLHINKEKCLFERDIDDLLLKADEAALNRIIAIADAQTIARVRGHAARLSGSVPSRVLDVVDYRYNEIRNGQRVSKITVSKLPQNQPDAKDRKIKELQSQMAAMQEMLAKFMQMQSAMGAPVPAAVTDPVPDAVKEELTKKKGGRPRKGEVTE